MLEAIFTPYDNLVKVSGLYQYDYGQKLCIKGIELPNISEVHFACDLDKEAEVRIATVEGDSIIVDIPNILLQEGKTIKCWLFIIEDGVGYTEKTIHLDVIPRAKPQDFIGEDEDAQKLLEEFLVKVDADVKEMQETVETCIEENEGFKDFISQTNNAFQENMLEDYEEYKASLKQIATNSIDFFLDPTQWVDGVYTCDISHMEWSEYARLQVNFEASNTNMENAQVITRYGRSGDTFYFYADNETPTKPILVTLMYSGEMVEGTPYVDESLGTKTVTWTQWEDVEDEDTLVILNAEESKTDASIYRHTVNFEYRNTGYSGYFFGNYCYSNYGASLVQVKVDDYDFSNQWQIDFNAFCNGDDYYDVVRLCAPYSTSSTLLIDILKFQLECASYARRFMIKTYDGTYGDNGENLLRISFPTDFDYDSVHHYTIQFDGTNIRWIVRSSANVVMLDQTVALPQASIDLLKQVSIIDIGNNVSDYAMGMDEFRLRKVLDEDSFGKPHIRGYDVAYTNYKTIQVEYQKEVTLTEASYMKASEGKLYRYDTNTNTWIEA